MADILKQQLSLVIYLIDTTTGGYIGENRVELLKNGMKCETISRENGTYLLLNEPRDNFSLSVQVYGFEKEEREVDYELLDAKLPIIEIFMIPLDMGGLNDQVNTLQGVMVGMTKISAVPLYLPQYNTREYDQKKKIIKMFNPYRKTLLHRYYGIIKKDYSSFESIVVEEQPKSDTIRIKDSLEEEFQVDAVIARIVYGKVMSKGKYLLRVQNDAAKLPYLVKYECKGKIYYQKIDFSETTALKAVRKGKVRNGVSDSDRSDNPVS